MAWCGPRYQSGQAQKEFRKAISSCAGLFVGRKAFNLNVLGSIRSGDTGGDSANADVPSGEPGAPPKTVGSSPPNCLGGGSPREWPQNAGFGVSPAAKTRLGVSMGNASDLDTTTNVDTLPTSFPSGGNPRRSTDD